MTIYQPTSSDSTKRPPCSKCGSPTQLAMIVPEEPDYETRTFVCTICDLTESVTVKYR
jgi:hypothetical protein